MPPTKYACKGLKPSKSTLTIPFTLSSLKKRQLHQKY